MDPTVSHLPDGVGGLEYDDMGLPKAQGLYDPQNEKDACGVGFVVNIKGVATRKVRILPF